MAPIPNPKLARLRKISFRKRKIHNGGTVLQAKGGKSDKEPQHGRE